MSTDKVCCICNGPIDPHTTPEGKVYWTHGHNALPVKDGRCCTACNSIVLSARLSALSEVASLGDDPKYRKGHADGVQEVIDHTNKFGE